MYVPRGTKLMPQDEKIARGLGLLDRAETGGVEGMEGAGGVGGMTGSLSVSAIPGQAQLDLARLDRLMRGLLPWLETLGDLAVHQDSGVSQAARAALGPVLALAEALERASRSVT
jgi:hypothetical protein